jgi:hypothetical protein
MGGEFDSNLGTENKKSNFYLPREFNDFRFQIPVKVKAGSTMWIRILQWSN